LRTLDVLVLPSLTTVDWREQFGHVLIEAMASGVPVVGSDSGAIPEVIGEAGRVVPEGNPEALRSTLAQLQAHPAMCADLARRGRERVLACFTHERIAAVNVEFFEQVLGP
jgi:glycosyltransferase involved in cell wall biosynthesis